MNKIKEKLLERKLAYGGTLATGLIRLFPVIPNFSPVGAMSIYSGARLRGPMMFILPLGILLVTNYILSLTHGYPFMNAAMAFVFGSFALNILLGRLLRNTENPLAIGGTTLFASIQFFLVTNLGVWLMTGTYAPDLNGLGQCLLAAVPFFRYTIAGDLVFTGVLFGLHHLLSQRYFPAEAIPRFHAG